MAVHRWPLHRNAAATISRAAPSRSSHSITTAGFFLPARAARARAAGRPVNMPADVRRSRERDARDTRVTNQGVADDGSPAGHEVSHSPRQAGLDEQLHQKHRRPWRQGRRLEHHGVSERQCGRDLAHRRHDRKIPGTDRGHDTGSAIVWHDTPARSLGNVWPPARLASPAMKRASAAARPTSPTASARALPCSSVTIRPSSFFASSRSWANRKSTAPR